MSVIAIDDVVIGERARKDLGDLTDLQESIGEIGLLNPITLMRDGELLCGARRLEACRQLGWQKIPFTQLLSREDALVSLLAERDENTCRKDMTASELVVLGRRIEELERLRAKERQLAGVTLGPTEPKGQTDKVVGEALGMSQSTYKRLKAVENATRNPDPVVAKTAKEQLVQLDQGAISPTAAAAAVRNAATRDHEQDAGVPIPITRKTGPKRLKARAEARHSLVAVAIALQTAARQLSSVNAVDLEFGPADKDLDQAPAIIADAVKSITNSLKEIGHERTRTATA